MVNRDISQIWVPVSFKKMLKKNAADKDMPLLDYCRHIADKDDPFGDTFKIKNDKKTFFKL